MTNLKSYLRSWRTKFLLLFALMIFNNFAVKKQIRDHKDHLLTLFAYIWIGSDIRNAYLLLQLQTLRNLTQSPNLVDITNPIRS
jgi:hypothetical protein